MWEKESLDNYLVFHSFLRQSYSSAKAILMPGWFLFVCLVGGLVGLFYSFLYICTVQMAARRKQNKMKRLYELFF